MTHHEHSTPSEQPYDPDEDIDTQSPDQSPGPDHPSQAEGEDDESAEAPPGG